MSFPNFFNIFSHNTPNGDDSPEGTFLQSTSGEKIALKSVHVDGHLDGLLLGTTIRQNYCNDTGKNLEIVYTFPVAFDTRLLGMNVEIGGKRLRGVVIEKKEAEEKYEKAMDAGDTPVMVQESSPGLYTANLGNIKDKETVGIEIRCSQLLRFEQDRIRVKIPTVIAPRYGDSHKEGGLARHETDAVDLSAKYPLTIKLNVHGETAKAKISCPSHRATIVNQENGVSVLLESGAMLDRDFILLLQGLRGHSFAVSSPDDEQHVMLASFCPRLPVKADPVSLKILVDCSGSMSGDSIFQAKKALQSMLQELKPCDYISYSRFGSDVEHQNKRMQACSEEVLQQLAKQVTATDADMGGTEMESALASTFRDVALPDGEHNRPNLLLITDDLVWNSTGILNRCVESGHRIFAIGVGSAPAENLLRDITAKTGGACEFVSPREDMSATVVRMFHRMRAAQTNRLKVDWGTEPVWQSRLPLSVFDGETVHLFAVFAEAPVEPPKLSWEADGKTEHAVPDGISTVENEDVARLAAAHRMKTAAREEALAIALKYQLASDLTSLFLVYLREGEDKVTELPEVHQVPQMMTAGSHGYGSVMGSAVMSTAAVHCSFSKHLVSTERCAAISDEAMYDKEIPVSKAASYALSPQELLERFDKAVLGNQGFSEFLKSIDAASGNNGMGALVGRLGQQTGLAYEQAWAVMLDWLMEQLADAYTPSRQAGRVLRAQLKGIDQTRIEALRNALASELSSVSPGEWHKAA